MFNLTHTRRPSFSVSLERTYCQCWRSRGTGSRDPMLLKEESVAQPSQRAIWQLWVPLEQNLPFRRTVLTQALKLIRTQTLEH